MSKSKGNVVTPFALLEEHGSDGVRYWAAKGRPGVDTMFDAGQMKVGRRLAIKVLNASKFMLAKAEPLGPITAAVDRAMLHEPRQTSSSRPRRRSRTTITRRALDVVEREFWGFCDDYLEFVKGRRYGEQGPRLRGSANSALMAALSRLLAAACAVSCRLRPRKCGRGGRADRFIGRHGRRRRSSARRPATSTRMLISTQVELRARGARRSAEAAVGSKAAAARCRS